MNAFVTLPKPDKSSVWFPTNSDLLFLLYSYIRMFGFRPAFISISFPMCLPLSIEQGPAENDLTLCFRAYIIQWATCGSACLLLGRVGLWRIISEFTTIWRDVRTHVGFELRRNGLHKSSGFRCAWNSADRRWRSSPKNMKRPLRHFWVSWRAVSTPL